MKYKTQVPSVRMTVRRIIYDDPAEAATALERWNSSASVMLELMARYEAQSPENLALEGAEPTKLPFELLPIIE